MKKQLQCLLLLVSVWSYGQNPVYQFDFDGNMNNTVVSSNFGGWISAGSGSVSYVNNRLGEAGKAVQIPNTLNFTGSATSLPFGNQSRTLSFWAKFVNDNDTKTFPVVGWGNNTAGNAYGFWRNGVQNSYYTWGVGNDYNVPQTNAQIQASNNGWVHIAMTYNNTNNSFVIYYNGVDAGSYSRVLITNGNTLYLNRLVNSNSGTGDAIQIDDLKIYNTALTATQIQALYNPNASGSAPTVSNVYVSGGQSTNSATVFFTVNPGGNTTTTEISVTGFGAGIGSVLDGPTVTGTNEQVLQYNIQGLNPGTCYSFNVRAVNSAGAQFSDDQAFCTLDDNFNFTPVYHFEFNGNTQDKNDPTVAFTNPNSGFADNNTALRLNNTAQALNLPYLPQGAHVRTVAIKLAYENGALSAVNNVFSYGSATNQQSFGYNQENTSQAVLYYWADDVVFNNTINTGTYHILVFVYDGLDTKIYQDGFLVGSSPSIIPNTVGTIFRLGRTSTGLGGFFNGRIDDLRIYNVALNAGDVTQLTQTLANTSFDDALTLDVYPNPAQDIVHVLGESALKSVEVYSLLGQKVLTTTQKQINVSGWAKGMYLVKMTDLADHTTTQRLMVK